MTRFVDQVASVINRGNKVIIVTSGAIASGITELGVRPKPNDLVFQQTSAATGQSILMAHYRELFKRHRLKVAQILLTQDDLSNRTSYVHICSVLDLLLQLGVVPIINENDVVSFTELKIGDNDKLSALVASLLPADLLLILTTVDGVVENFGKANPRTIPLIERVDETLERTAGGTDSATAVGGMASKIQAAKIAVRSGIPLVIASGRKKRVMARVVAGEEEGTLFAPQAARLRGRKRWIAFFHHPKGALFVDAGARKAVREGGKSLLPPGVARCDGDFAAGDVVRICDLDGTEFARGIAAFGAAEVKARKLQRVEVVHRDNLVIL
jgi:glutamate 5-kinase